MKHLFRTLALSALLPLLSLAAVARPHAASDDEPAQPRRDKIDLSLEVRGSFCHEDVRGGSDFTGFRGEYLNVRLEGTIGRSLSYHFRHRLNKFENAASDLFNATDWLYLTWRPAARTALSFGKQPVMIGGYEVDRTPVDGYFFTVFGQHLACYQFAVSAAQTFASGDHTLTAQCCNSPFGPIGCGLFAYNLMWSGRMGSFSTLWSANLLEYDPGRYIAYLSLGTAFEQGPFRLEIDIMERATPRRMLRLKDMTFVGEASCFVHERVKLLFKCGYDFNKTHWSEGMPPAPDRCVAPGTDRFFYGGGIEVFPLRRSRDLRLHALCADANTVVEGADRPMSYVNIGLLWRVRLYSRR